MKDTMTTPPSTTSSSSSSHNSNDRKRKPSPLIESLHDLANKRSEPHNMEATNARIARDTAVAANATAQTQLFMQQTSSNVRSSILNEMKDIKSMIDSGNHIGKAAEALQKRYDDLVDSL